MKMILTSTILLFSKVLQIMIFARIILSFIPIRRAGVFATISRFLFALTEPILGPIRRLLYRPGSGISGISVDFSPLVSYILIELATYVLLQLVAML